MARRQHVALSILLAVFFFLSLSYFFTSAPGRERLIPTTTRPGEKQHPSSPPTPSKTDFVIDLDALPTPLLHQGDSIAPKLENATLKAELGRATWRFLHTMVARFPDKPTAQERAMLDSFVRMFGFLYPCGDCARHFRRVLAEYPPQTSSRSAAAGWMCFVHNVVNKRLKKRAFDCEKIGDFYDCGCAEDDKKKKKKDKEKEGGKVGEDKAVKAGDAVKGEEAGGDAEMGGDDAKGKTAGDGKGENAVGDGKGENAVGDATDAKAGADAKEDDKVQDLHRG